ncbi:DUF7482 domain-containing protein [Saccharospirillum impatiens]|uniref:DUF7482 domain-containing protein n=1 Tax=Saccharospirillum impatiens TaxID=169438 RepID=UPI0004062D5D|nr:hypothetical protein [Saccharospirillum impatiens]
MGGRLITLVLITLLAACSSLQPAGTSDPAVATPAITLPLVASWYNGKVYYYVTTDAWPRSMAIAKGANHTPRFQDALPPRPKPPGLKTVLERVYTFPGGEQINVIPSAPEPIGPASNNQPYSPVWQMVEVRWLRSEQQQELTSEAQLLDAEAAGWVELTVTDIVVNCAVVADAQGNRLPGSQLHGLPDQPR